MAKKRKKLKPATSREEIDRAIERAKGQNQKGIAARQEHSLTFRKKTITLWKTNLPNYDDEENTED